MLSNPYIICNFLHILNMYHFMPFLYFFQFKILNNEGKMSKFENPLQQPSELDLIILLLGFSNYEDGF